MSPAASDEQTETPERLAGAVRAALDQTGHGWLRHVAVAVTRDGVSLSGRVPSFYLKQMAQVTVLAVPGVHELRNELQVDDGR